MAFINKHLTTYMTIKLTIKLVLFSIGSVLLSCSIPEVEVNFIINEKLVKSVSSIAGVPSDINIVKVFSGEQIEFKDNIDLGLKERIWNFGDGRIDTTMTHIIIHLFDTSDTTLIVELCIENLGCEEKYLKVTKKKNTREKKLIVDKQQEVKEEQRKQRKQKKLEKKLKNQQTREEQREQKEIEEELKNQQAREEQREQKEELKNQQAREEQREQKEKLKNQQAREAQRKQKEIEEELRNQQAKEEEIISQKEMGNAKQELGNNFSVCGPINRESVNDCSGYTIEQASFKLKPSQIVALISATIYSSNCGAIEFQLKGSDINRVEKMELTKGINQLVFSDLSFDELNANNNYVLSIATDNSINCPDGKPMLLNALTCDVDLIEEDRLKIDFNNNVCLFNIKYQY